jgi:NAD(P)-dependent dehydrogenase (short-subunit alcohol dehydrogenase family)
MTRDRGIEQEVVVQKSFHAIARLSGAPHFSLTREVMENLFDLTGEVAVVVGATGVLGGALASGLAASGAAVAVLGRDQQRGLLRVTAIREAGGVAEFYPIDARNRSSLHCAHQRIADALGAPTILVNAAGGNDARVTVTAGTPFEHIDENDWRANFDLNLVGGALLPCQEFGGAMAVRGAGSIVNLTSVAAHVPLSRVAAYSASKAAVLSLTRFLAREWAARGVRVNSITPGFFPSDQNRTLLFNDDGTPTERAKAILQHTPMARFGQPRDLIGACIFLASRRASGFVTGADICVDGGFLSKSI